MPNTTSLSTAPPARSLGISCGHDDRIEEQGHSRITPLQRDCLTVTREEAQEARRRAAEHGDYATAEFWYRIGCELVTQS